MDPRAIYVRENRAFTETQNELLDVLQYSTIGIRAMPNLPGLTFFLENVEIDPRVIKRTNYLARSIDFEFPEFALDIPTPPSVTRPADEELEALVKEGLSRHYQYYHSRGRLTDAVARARHELTMIRQLSMSPYFLLIRDIITYARTRGILVGPGRGSVSGSLVAYLLGITEVDPIEYGLYFERFLNQARTGLPDIDIDFEDERRREVLEYIHNTYGVASVAQIITHQSLGARNAIRDVGRYLELENSEIDAMLRYIEPNTPMEDQIQANHLLRNRVYSSTRSELL